MSYRWGELKFTNRATPRLLEDRSVTILGGGPSLTSGVAKAVQIGPTIAVNNSFALLEAPGLVVALDRRWYHWHGQSLKIAGHFAVTAQPPNAILNYSGPFASLIKNRNGVWPDDPKTLPGQNSGQAAICLAILMGARQVFLVGFDMGFQGEKTHWHGGHVIPSSQPNYEQRFRPALEKLVIEAKERGVMIASLTDTQADLPRMDLSDALKELRLENCMDYPETSTPL